MEETVTALGSSTELATHLFRECWAVGTGSEVDLCRAFGWEKQAAQFLVQLIATKQILDNLRGEHAAPIAAEPAPVSRMWVMPWEYRTQASDLNEFGGSRFMRSIGHEDIP